MRTTQCELQADRKPHGLEQLRKSSRSAKQTSPDGRCRKHRTCPLACPTGLHWFALVRTGSHRIAPDRTKSHQIAPQTSYEGRPKVFPTSANGIMDLSAAGAFWGFGGERRDGLAGRDGRA